MTKPELTQGHKDDADKARLDLIAPEFLFAIAQVLAFGAKKYADRNWEKGMHWSRPFSAAQRHLWAWWGGKEPVTRENFLFGTLDTETGFSHLWHAACCLLFLVAYEQRKHLHVFDDRPTDADTKEGPMFTSSRWGHVPAPDDPLNGESDA